MEARIRHFLNTKKIKILTEEIKKEYPFLENEVNLKNSKVEYVETSDKVILYVVDNKLFWIKRDALILPSITLLNLGITFPNVVVDMGAVPFISKGADVMIPGIVNYPENLNKGAIVKISDIKHNKAIAVGRNLLDSEEMKKTNRGKAIDILHHVGDDIWNLALSLNLKTL